MADKIVWSGKTASYHHKWHDTPNPEGVKEGIREVVLLDAQWSTCPIEVMDEVRRMWSEYEFGNDNFYIDTKLEEIDAEEYPATVQYIKEQRPNLASDAQILIHWWW
jgi:hypothetical protein